MKRLQRKSEKELLRQALLCLIWKLAAITPLSPQSIVNVRRKEGKLPEIEVAIRLKQKQRHCKKQKHNHRKLATKSGKWSTHMGNKV